MLSLFVPGLGQIYNGQLVKGLLFFTGLTVLETFFLGIYFKILESEFSAWYVFVIYGILLLSLVLVLGIVVESITAARRLAKQDYYPKAYNRSLVLFIFYILLVMLPAWLFDFGLDYTGRTYKIPTRSVVPTLQPQDFILVSYLYYRNRGPQRHDLVIFIAPGTGSTVSSVCPATVCG